MTAAQHPLRSAQAPVLTIDSDALVRKLGAARVHSPGQLVVELVRWALRRGAGTVEVSVRRQGIEVVDDGRAAKPSVLDAVRAALDPTERPDRRRDAASWLDQEGLSPLLAVTSRPWRKAVLTWSREAIELVPGASPRSIPLSGGSQNVVRLVGRTDRRRTRAAVRRACRFVQCDVRLDGTPIARGFTDAVIEGRVERPLPGRIAVPSRVREPFVWLLVDGVVAASATVPGAASFEAALDVSEHAAPDATASGLRDVLRPHAVALLEQALMLIARALESGRLTGRPEVEQAVLHELIRSLAAGRGDRCLGARPVVPAMGSDGGVRMSIADLRHHASDGVLECLDPTDTTHAVSAKGPVPILSEPCRAAFGRWLGATVVPAAGTRRSGLWGWWVRLRREHSVTGVGHALLRRRVPSEDLAPIHRELEAAVRTACARLSGDIEVVWVRGRSLVTGRRRVLLPFDDPQLRRWLELAREEPEWLHPLTRFLTGGRADSRWRHRWWRASFNEPV